MRNEKSKSTVDVIIDTPKGSRNKYKYDEERKLFMLSKVLPAGAVFPFDFGYIPGTKGGDGDPVDVLVLMDEPAFVGCLVPSRLVGALRAEQMEEEGETVENDRLIGVAEAAPTYEEIRDISDLSQTLLDEIEHFFVSYNEARGRKFTPKGFVGKTAAARRAA